MGWEKEGKSEVMRTSHGLMKKKTPTDGVMSSVFCPRQGTAKTCQPGTDPYDFLNYPTWFLPHQVSNGLSDPALAMQKMNRLAS